MDWVKINDEGELEFIAEEVKLVPEVQAILTLAYNKGPKDFEGRKKLRAKNELKYLFLKYSIKSPYKDFSEKEREIEARSDCNFSNEWVPSTELKALIPIFEKGNSNKAVNLLRKVHKFIDKFEHHLDNIDLNERTNTGGLLHTPKSVIDTLSSLPKLVQTLQELENQAKNGIIVKAGSKGDHDIGWLATPNATKPVKQEEELEE